MLTGISAAALIAAVADLKFPPFVKILGDASYGLYLLHFPAIVFMTGLFSTNIGLGWLLAGSLAAGIAFGIFDHWLYRYLTRIGN